MNYEEMSDFEINKAVALALGIRLEHDSEYHDHPLVDSNNSYIMWYEGKTYRTADYCNRPSDAWPIIIDNTITILPDGDEWAASSSGGWQSGGNPLRNAMIVFLQMQENKE